MKNNKGFTLIELLAVVVLLSILGSIGTIAYQHFVTNTKNKVYETYMRSMYDTAMILETEAYENNTTSLIPAGIGEDYAVKIYVEDLVTKGGLSYIQNPDNSDDTCPNSYVQITELKKTTIKDDTTGEEYYNDNINLEYHVFLDCNSFKLDKVFD